MTEMFFPGSSKPAFMRSQNTQSSLDPRQSHGFPTGGVAEERLLAEIRDVRRQIQSYCVEELRGTSQLMLQEIRREIQAGFDGLNPDARARASSQPRQSRSSIFRKAEPEKETMRQARSFGSLRRKPPPERACGTPGEASAGSEGERPVRKEARSNTLPAKIDCSLPPRPHCVESPPASPSVPLEAWRPILAPGEKPPLMPFEVEESPEPPVVEAPPPPPPPMPPTKRAAEGLRGSADAVAAPAGAFTAEKTFEAISEEQSKDKSETSWEAGNLAARKRKLSLKVDTAGRKSIKDHGPTQAWWQMSASEFLNSTKFDNLIGALILTNALTIGLQTDYQAKHVTGDIPDAYQVIERIFLVCFSLELILRLYVQKFRFFVDPKNFVWNYFDLAVVLAQAVEEVLTLIAGNGGSSAVNADQFKLLKVVRILRVIRILRVVRVLHLIEELRTIISSIMGSFRSLGWTVVLLLLMIYIVSVYFCQTTTDFIVENGGSAAVADNEDMKNLTDFFGSLGRTILSLWQAMSGGADWDSMARPLIEVGVHQCILFAGYIAFALLALMNVVTGVFVQTALQSAKDEEDAFLVDQVLKLFERENAGDDTTITLGQIEDCLQDPAVAADWKSINVQPAEAQYLFGLLDIDEAGEISFQEFLSGCLRLHGHSKSMDVLTVMQEARAFVRQWRMASQRWDETGRGVQAALDGLVGAVGSCTALLARLSRSVDAAADAAIQSQDKIGRLEKRVRSFETSLCSVRIAASSMSKVNDIIDSIILPTSPTSVGGGEDGSASNTPSALLGSLGTVDEV